MILWREGRVVSLDREWDGALECTVDVLNPASGAWTPIAALAYPHLVGRLRPGDAVLLNTTALEAGLGTGGYAFVVAPRDRLPDQSGLEPSLGPGHLVKARYTPLQAMVLGVDEPDSVHHEVLQRGRRPGRHAGGGRRPALGPPGGDRRDPRPAAEPSGRLRDDGRRGAAGVVLAHGGRAAGGRLAGQSCISSGQAFGGDLEAATVHTGLLAARLVVEADVAVVAQGPGVLGTGTRWGFSGVGVGDAVNAAATLGGRPVAALRISAADSRARHRGVSHHSLTALGRVALAPCDVVVPNLAELDPRRRARRPRGAGPRSGGRACAARMGGTASSRSAWTGCVTRWRAARCRCRRWAAAGRRRAGVPGRGRRRAARRVLGT